MQGLIKAGKAAVVPGALAAAGVVLAQSFAPAKTGYQLLAAALGGILGVAIASQVK